ncbi:hypothetical protein LDBPK_191680 [Leishmania donovani]|uniref:Uncharacterized protein n=1 Tax=Leishmania donovani TaxID=5661 RepID=E9BG20_LEIDO|nr:hypothetical protein LDBPK_191680 [Leishmania donovani]CBZ34196.1 hypothetical protein LDBPK_191680 [Leishmania donovani]
MLRAVPVHRSCSSGLPMHCLRAVRCVPAVRHSARAPRSQFCAVGPASARRRGRGKGVAAFICRLRPCRGEAHLDGLPACAATGRALLCVCGVKVARLEAALALLWPSQLIRLATAAKVTHTPRSVTGAWCCGHLNTQLCCCSCTRTIMPHC